MGFDHRNERIAALLAVTLMACVFWSDRASAGAPTPDAAAPSAAEPSTLRDAVALMGQTYDFNIVGLDRLGTEAPNWPPTEQPPAAVLKRLLQHYGYIAELKTGSEAGRDGMPQHLLVVGPSADRDESVDRTSNPFPPALRRDVDAHNVSPSALSRSLGQLALSVHPGPVPAVPSRPVAGTSAQVGALSGPSASAAAPSSSGSTPDMAALTNAARASVVGLVTSLRNACKGSGC